MRIFTFLLLSLVLSACSGEVSMANKTDAQAIFVLIENGGTIAPEDQDEARLTINHLLHQLSKLDRRKATRNAQIHIVLSALPNRISWSGTPAQLLEQAAQVQELITFKPTYSDLVIAFEQIETTFNLTRPDKTRLYWVGPTIHVPFQDADGEIEIKVPQELPEVLALAALAPHLSTLKILRVHADQDQVLQAYLATLGVFKRAGDGSLDFELLGVAQTKSNLSDLL